MFFKSIKTSILAITSILSLSLSSFAKELNVSFIDIGQGDAELIELPEGKNILIDAGDREGSTKLITYLKARNIKNLDLVIISHPHLDHYGGLLKVVKAIPINQVYESGVTTSSSTYLKLLKAFAEKKVKFGISRKGQEIKYDKGIILKILAPEEPLLKNTKSDANNASIVAKLTYNKVSFLFTGDIEEESQDRILKGFSSELSSTILKVAHHGSRYTSSNDFLKAVNPKVAVISSAIGNSYGHPHQETLDRLAQNKIKLYRTDEKGTIIINTDGETYTIKNEISSVKVKPNNAKVDLNKANPEELELLMGINAEKAKQIEKLRPIKNWEQLAILKLSPEALTALKKESTIKTSGSDNSTKKININIASLSELNSLPAIGDKTSQKIISARPFKSIKELEKVIGKKRLDKVINLIVIE